MPAGGPAGATRADIGRIPDAVIRTSILVGVGVASGKKALLETDRVRLVGVVAAIAADRAVAAPLIQPDRRPVVFADLEPQRPAAALPRLALGVAQKRGGEAPAALVRVNGNRVEPRDTGAGAKEEEAVAGEVAAAPCHPADRRGGGQQPAEAPGRQPVGREGQALERDQRCKVAPPGCADGEAWHEARGATRDFVGGCDADSGENTRLSASARAGGGGGLAIRRLLRQCCGSPGSPVPS